jgi:hypothetical protein
VFEELLLVAADKGSRKFQFPNSPSSMGDHAAAADEILDIDFNGRHSETFTTNRKT